MQQGLIQTNSTLHVWKQSSSVDVKMLLFQSSFASVQFLTSSTYSVGEYKGGVLRLTIAVQPVYDGHVTMS